MLTFDHFIVMFHLDADELLTCPIRASIDEVMPVQTLAVPGATPKPLLYQGVVPGQCLTQNVISLSSHL